jgi:hypothetical protein
MGDARRSCEIRTITASWMGKAKCIGTIADSRQPQITASSVCLASQFDQAITLAKFGFCDWFDTASEPSITFCIFDRGTLTALAI